VEVTFGVKYAQYTDAVTVKYLEKGKRNGRGFTLCGAQSSSTPGMTCKVSRYTSCDPRYQLRRLPKAGSS
jgi:hypothetical protein